MPQLRSFAKHPYLPSTPQPTHRLWSPCTAWAPACTARGQLQAQTPLRSAWWPCRRWSGSIWLPGAAQQHPTGPPWVGVPTRDLAQIPPTTGILPQTAQRKGNTVSVYPHEEESMSTLLIMDTTWCKQASVESNSMEIWLKPYLHFH